MDLPVRNQSGFTLIELLVALVISSIVAGSIFQVIKGEGEFVQMHSAREEVLQNSRGALELIGSELRAVPPGGLEVAHSNALIIRAPRVWGVVCSAPSGGNIDVAVPIIDGLNYSTSTGAQLAAYVNSDNAWTAASGVVTSTGAPSATCGGQPVAAGSESRRFTVANVPLTPSGAAPAVGDPIYLFDRISYELGTSSRPGLWIRRKIGTGNFEPLAGPIADDGLEFVYCCNSSGGNFSTTALLTSLTGLGSSTGLSQTERELTTRVDIVVEAESHSSLNGIAQTAGDTATVFLRNRGTSW